jgi:hypothetical protein
VLLGVFAELSDEVTKIKVSLAASFLSPLAICAPSHFLFNNLPAKTPIKKTQITGIICRRPVFAGFTS